MEALVKVRLQQQAHLTELCEDQCLLASVQQVGDQLVKARQLARSPGQLRPVAQRVRRVVADLLEASQRGEHEAAPAHACGLLCVGQQLVDNGLVHVRLLAGERRPRDLLDLVGQVWHQRLVGLRAAQQERPGEAAQFGGGYRVVLALDRVGEVLAELRGIPQQPGGDDLEDGPQLGESVLDGRTGERDSLPCLQRAHRASGAGVGVLHCLRFVEHGGCPRHLLKRVEVACRNLIGGDDQVVLRDRVDERLVLQPARAVMNHDAHERGEAGGLGFPVANDRERADH